MLAQLLECDQSDVHYDTLKALNTAAGTSTDRIQVCVGSAHLILSIHRSQAVVDTGITAKLIPLVDSHDERVMLAALNALGAIARGDHGHIQVELLQTPF